MTADSLIIQARSSGRELRDAAVALEDSIWEPLGFLSYTEAHQEYYPYILENFADLQLCLVDEDNGEVLALANCVPISYHGDVEDLPEEGWDWLVERGGSKVGQRANVLGALAVSVPKEHRAKGYARRMIRALKDLAVRRGYDALVVPVRPTAKCKHPMMPMSEYMQWKTEDGQSYDPWLRSHVSQGARLIKPCERSMVVDEHVAFWETWAGKRFSHSGGMQMTNALAPIMIDLERQSGRYEEPNVWVGYRL